MKRRIRFKKCVLMLVLISTMVSGAFAKEYTVKSPDETISVLIKNSDGQITYKVSQNGESIIGVSGMSILNNQSVQIISVQINVKDTIWKPVWGQFSEIRDFHNELKAEILHTNGLKGQLLCRVFNDGFGFRYSIEPTNSVTQLNFKFDFNVQDGSVGYISNGEREPLGPLAIDTCNSSWAMPVIARSPEGVHLSIMETDLYSARTFNSTMVLTTDGKSSTMRSSIDGALNETGVTITPWRMVKVEKSFGDMLTNNIHLNLAAENQIEDPSWIVPGKFTWDWRVRGHIAPDGFKYDTNMATLKRHIDFAAENGMKYFLVDGVWRKVPFEDLKAYAQSKGVELILYYDHRGSAIENVESEQEVVDYFDELDVAGVKWGFRGNNVEFTRSALDKLAKAEMLVSFHDNPAPLIGTSRTIPITIRENCHAQLDRRTAFTPTAFLKMALINAQMGPLDQANGFFNIKEISEGGRAAGPRQAGTYHSTVVSECARVLITHAFLLGLPDAPDAYETKADLFEFLREMPVTWDDTRVLQSAYGEYLSMARRSGDEWFVGSVNNEEVRTLSIELDFLKPGITYEATIYEDAADAHCVSNPEAYEIKTITVKKDDVIPAKMALGGGHAMILRPVKQKAGRGNTPNIVVVLADDMAWADVGYNGQKYFETPHIDKLTVDGMRFNHAYSGASVCSPSRACLISGMYSPRHSIYHPGNRARGKLEYMKLAVPNRVVKNETYDWFQAIGNLEPDVNSLAKVLNPAGYVTGRFGKWHVGSNEQGFDQSMDVPRGWRDKDSAKKLTDAGIEFIRENKDRPFFLYLCHHEVHKPLVADSVVIEKYKAKKKQTGGDFNPVYAAMVEATDNSVGRLRAELQELGLEDNTLFIFTSDNGGFPDATSNLPLHGYKGTLFEGGIRIPTCMVWPKQIQPGSSNDTPTTFVDYLPTFADVVGTSLTDSKHPIDGVTMLPLMKGNKISDRAIFWHFPLYADLDHGVHPGSFPIFGTERPYWRGVPATVIRRGKYKLIYYYEDKSFKLFDVVNDMGESKDLSKEQPEIAAQLLAELKAWTTNVNAPVPDRINPVFDPN